MIDSLVSPRRARSLLALGWFTCLLALCMSGLAGTARAGDGMAYHLSVAGGLEWLGYQEHLDPNGPDSVLARCTVGGQPSTCFIDSDAALRNVLLDIRGRAEIADTWLFGGAARITLSTGTGREEWQIAANQDGSKGPSQTFQTNDLTYRWQRFDLFGGYRIIPLVRPIAGVRISRARQVRDDFEPPPTGVEEAIEDIDSVWFLFGAFGEQDRPGVAFGYRFQAALPFTVTTTNTAIPGVEFTDVGGYAVEGAVSLAVPVAQQARLRFEAEGGLMHWDGSAIETFGQNRIAKWPENDTQMLLVTAGIEIVL